METFYKLPVNGQEHVVSVATDKPLLYVRRNDLALNGPKFGCELAQCGACAVLKDSREIRVTAAAAVGITTSKGLTPDCLHPLQTTFVAQCGCCTSGMLIATVDLPRSNPRPTEDEIKKYMDGHLCRCGPHVRIIEAIVHAARAEVPI
jgi:nicotinate dehydrogenase subunit A